MTHIVIGCELCDAVDCLLAQITSVVENYELINSRRRGLRRACLSRCSYASRSDVRSAREL